VTLLENGPEGEEVPQEQQENPGGGAPEQELPECTDHQPTTFLKGKPLCIYMPYRILDKEMNMVIYLMLVH